MVRIRGEEMGRWKGKAELPRARLILVNLNTSTGSEGLLDVGIYEELSTDESGGHELRVRKERDVSD
jgi:hypothetical protein